jgi:hypothetical protein
MTEKETKERLEKAAEFIQEAWSTETGRGNGNHKP